MLEVACGQIGVLTAKLPFSTMIWLDLHEHHARDIEFWPPYHTIAMAMPHVYGLLW